MLTGFLNPQTIITAAGVWGLLIVCGAVFVETGLLVGFFLPGDTLLFFTGVLTLSGAVRQPLWLVVLAVAASAFLGDQLGYLIGRKSGPAIFERRESGLFSRRSVTRTQAFFDRFGPAAVTVARLIPVVRTFAPVAAGVGKMRRTVFVAYNLAGAVGWAIIMIMLGYGLAHIPGVTAVVSRYIDVVLVGIVVISIVPVIVRAIVIRQRSRA